MNFPDRDNALAKRGLIAVALAFGAMFSFKSVSLFAGGTLGIDYALFYPRLGAYLFWIERNGLFSIPHYLPYACAGIFDFADPQSFYFSIPTLAAVLLPIGMVWPLTTILFGMAGAAGGYALARFGAGTRRSSAVLCGLLVLCNGFFLTRMAIGHVIFHGFMLIPWIALFCLHPGSKTGWRAQLPPAAAIGLLYAYLVYSGGAQIIGPSILSVLILILAVPRDSRASVAAAARLLAGGLAGLMISLPKLAATLHLMAYLDRSFYPLPGFPGFRDALVLAMSALFLEPSEAALKSIVNSRFPIAVHEAIYGVGLIPLAALCLHAADRCRAILRAKALPGISLRGVLLALVLALPILVNIHATEWTAFLKTVPLIRETSQPLRFLMIYIVPLAFAAAFVFERHIAGTAAALPVFLICAVVLALGLLQMDLERFVRNGYPQGRIEQRLAGHAGSLRVPIQSVGAELREGKIQIFAGGDDLFLDGASQAACYQPLFGYRLEKFRFDNLAIGPAKALIGGSYNFHNPSCYAYPSQNQCRPGDNFRRGQEAALSTFLDYGPLEDRRPGYLDWLGYLALAVLAGCVAASASGLLRKL